MKPSVLIAALTPFFATDAKPEDIVAAVDAQMALDKSAKDKVAKDAADKKAADAKAAKDKAAKDAKAAKDKAAKDGVLNLEGPETEIINNVTGDEDDMDGEDEDNEDPNEGKNTMDRKAMDKAIAAGVAAGLAADRALQVARRDVEPIIGVVAYDSAPEVYKAALVKLDIAVDGIHPSAFGAMVKQALKGGTATTPALAQDSGAGKVHSMAEAFPNFNRI